MRLGFSCYVKLAACLLSFLIALIPASCSAQKKRSYFDGPYITVNENDYKAEWIARGIKYSSTISKSDSAKFSAPGFPDIDLSNVSINANEPTEYSEVPKYFAISDIHGQHDLFLTLLKNHRVVDSLGQWIYGDGHLVIVGDIFDRGEKVTDCLWYLYNLEKQAQQAGGKVHVLLGNHELMVLHGDLRYIHPKYQYTMSVLDRSYESFYDRQSLLGQWLRSKNVSVVINDVVFVHGGFSTQVLKKEASLERINKIFKENLIDKKEMPEDTLGLASILMFDNGPLWYRGYANPNGFDVASADSILQMLNAEKIVVGHTSMPKIVSLHDDKIILIDSSIKFGKKGEVLIYERDSLFRGMMSGEKIGLGEESANQSSSPFEYVYNLGDGDLTIHLYTNVKKLIKRKLDEEYQECRLTAIHNKEFNRTWDVDIRSRGNMRKELCHLPPLKINFPKKTLRYLGFTGYDKLKLVMPCHDSKEYQQGIYKENLVYKLYQEVDSLGIRTRIVNLVLQDKKKVRYDFDGFAVEDPKEFVARTGAMLIDDDQKIMAPGIERDIYVKFLMFQYMICNSDWSFYNKHNVKVYYYQGAIQARPLPYDFDFSGIVGMPYAVPNKEVPIDDVRQAFFRGKGVSLEEIAVAAEFYNSKKEIFYNLIENDAYLSNYSKKSMTKYLDKFYKTLNDEKKWDKNFLNPRSKRNSSR